MKVLYQFYISSFDDSVKDMMEQIKSYGEIVNSRCDNQDFIYTEYKGKLYKFNRYCKKLIEKVEEIHSKNPCIDGSYGNLHVEYIDDRFSDKQFYKITSGKQECIEILKDAIIEYLYNKISFFHE